MDERLAATGRFKKDADIARTTDWAWFGVEQPLWVMPLKKEQSPWEDVTPTSGNERLSSGWYWVIDKATRQQNRLEALWKVKRFDISVDCSGGIWHRSKHGRRDVYGSYSQAPGQQLAGKAASAATELQNRGVCVEKLTHRLKVAEVRQFQVQLDGTTVGCLFPDAFTGESDVHSGSDVGIVFLGDTECNLHV